MQNSVKKIIVATTILIITGIIILFVRNIFFQNETLAAHHHFRLQLIVNGDQIDFSQNNFQEEYAKDQCSVGITETPIHFHDNMDQIVHIHWDKITGGQVLKYYGMNLIGGDNEIISYKPQLNIKKTNLPIKGDYLEDASKNNVWVYEGDQSSYQKRELNEFLNNDLEAFFDKKSKITLQREELKNSKYNYFNNPKAWAHSEDMENVESQNSIPNYELEKIQNLIGNVVIFVQKDEPSEQQIDEKFQNLQPLMESVCGG